MPETSQPGTTTLNALSAGGFAADCAPCSMASATVGGFLSTLSFGYLDVCSCPSPTTPSASGSFFTNPLGAISDSAGNVIAAGGDAAGGVLNAAGDAATKAAKAATPAVIAASVGIVMLAVAAIYVAHRL